MTRARRGLSGPVTVGPLAGPLVAAGALVAGLLGGVLWNAFATPTVLDVQGGGIVLNESNAGSQFGVIATFVVVGAVIGLVGGFLAGLVLRRPSPWYVPVLAAAAIVAAVVAWQLGDRLGPPDPSTVKGLASGDTLPDKYRLDTFPPFLAWPIAALLGYLLTVWWFGRPRSSPSYPGDDGTGQSDQIPRGQTDVEPTTAA